MNFKFKIYWLCLWLAGSGATAAQDSILVTKNFHFKDGLYFSFSSLKNNEPDIPADSIRLMHVTNPKTFLTQVEYIAKKSGDSPIYPEQLWAICMDGIPYIQIPAEEVQKPLATFAGLKVRGKISYFSYPVTEVEKVPIAAYNPLNGKPFRVGNIKKKNEILKEQILHWDTGEIRAFEQQQFLHWIQDDPRLWESVAALSKEDFREKLFKCLLIYDDRNPVYIRPSANQ